MPRTKGSKNKTALPVEERISAVVAEIEAMEEQLKQNEISAEQYNAELDRLSAAVGAYRLRPGEASLIIDIGTCITYDVIDETGSFLGGNIAPGYKMRLDAMHTFTDKLPDVPPCDIPDYRIGRSTTEAMKAGAYNGIVYEAEGMVAYLRDRYGRLNVFLTGGGAAYFAQNIGCGKIAEPNLIHIGLNEILRYNLKLTTE